MKITLLLAGLLALFPALPARAEPLELHGGRPFVTVELQGQHIEGLLDSGAELTILDRETAALLHVQPGEDVAARGTGKSVTTAGLVEGVEVLVLGRHVTLPVVAVMDLSEVGARLLGRPLPLIVGRDVFDLGRLRIDLARREIAWMDAGERPRGQRLELTTAHGIETVPVTLGATRAQADFDLGNGTGLLISEDLARQLKLEPVGVEPGGGIGGAKPRAVVFVPKLTIAGQVFRNVRAHVDPALRSEANIGLAQLAAFRIWTDFPGRAVYLEPRED